MLLFVVLCAMWLSNKALRPNISTAICVWLTIYVGFGLGSLIFDKNRLAASTPILQADRAELMLRFKSAFDSMDKLMPSASPKKFNSTAKELKQFTEQADELLAPLVEKNPKSLPILVRYVILEHYMQRPIDKTLAQLANADAPDAKDIAEDIGALYSKQPIDPHKVPKMEAELTKRLPRGWYQDSAMETFYQRTNQQAKLKALTDDEQGKNYTMLVKFAGLFVLAALTALAGAIIVLVTLIFLPRKLTTDEDKQLVAAPAAYGIKAVYGSFLAWLAAEMTTSYLLLNLTLSLHFHLADYGVLAAAIGILVTYSLANGPGLLFAYLIAMKPNGVSFFEGFKFRTHVGKLGPWRLIGIGIMTWVAAVPLVVLSALIAFKGLGSEGSSNPVIPQIMEAARSSNVLAILIFYFTVSVLAPICEESLFRGFLYSSLRRRLNFLPSALITALLFAGIHLDPGGFVPLFTLGLVFAFVVERTRSTLPTMIAHGLWNGITFTLVLLLFGN
jgi:hypothetical protein